MMTLNIRQGMLVAMLALVVMVIFAFSNHWVATGQLQPKRDSESDALVGRYQIVLREGVARHTWLLDTVTGKVWQEVQYTDVVGDPVIWQPQQRVDSEAELLTWIKGQKGKQ